MTNAELASSEAVDAVHSDGELIDALQRRLDLLKDRIDAAVPEGYDIVALRASQTDTKGEDVFDITSDERALGGLSGPFNVPGSQPLPAFSAAEARVEEDLAELIPGSAEDRLARAVLIVVAAIALAAAAYFAGLWWAERSAQADSSALGLLMAVLVAL